MPDANAQRPGSTGNPPVRGRDSDFAVYGRLIRLARPYWPHIVGLLLLNLLGPPLALLTPLPLKIAVDSAVGSLPVPAPLDRLLTTVAPSAAAALWLAAGLLGAVALLSQLQGLASGMLHAYAGERMTLHFRALLFRHAQRLSLLYHDERGTADSTFRIQFDSPSIQWIAVDGLIPFLCASLKLAGMVYVTAWIDWQLALVALAVSPILLVLSQQYKSRMQSQYKSLKDLESSAFSVIHEVLSAVRVVKAFGREDDEQERFVRRSGASLRARMQTATSEGFLSLLINLTTAAGTAGVLLLGVGNVRSGALTLGELLMVMTYLTLLYTRFRPWGRRWRVSRARSPARGGPSSCWMRTLRYPSVRRHYRSSARPARSSSAPSGSRTTGAIRSCATPRFRSLRGPGWGSRGGRGRARPRS